MKKFLLLLFTNILILNQLWAGAGIWHSSINLTINGEYADYKITENSNNLNQFKRLLLKCKSLYYF